MQGTPAASLLFARGERPCLQAIAALAEREADLSVSFVPQQVGWLELLFNGLTFDLSGLEPGKAAALPPQGHGFGLAPGAEASLQAIALRPGPHLAGASRMRSVLCALAQVTAHLATLPAVRAVCWHPARSWSAPAPFRNAVRGWIDGGRFPAFALAALAPTLEGGMQSEGLALFVDQELRIEPELAGDRATATEIGLQLVHRLFENGPVQSAETLAGPDGIRLQLEPSANRRIARVWRAE